MHALADARVLRAGGLAKRLSRRLYGESPWASPRELNEGLFFVKFQRLSPVPTSLRGVSLRRIPELWNIDFLASGNELAAGTFRVTITPSWRPSLIRSGRVDLG